MSRRSAPLLILVLASLVAATAAAAPEPRELLAAMAATPGERVAFSERRSNEMLREPIRVAGYVTMKTDGTLERRITEPFEETAAIGDDTATVERDGETRRVRLDRRGPGAAYLRALHALLRGDADALAERFRITASGSRDDWGMILTPSAPAVKRYLERIVVTGAGPRAQVIRIERRDGAWQEMRLHIDAP